MKVLRKENPLYSLFAFPVSCSQSTQELVPSELVANLLRAPNYGKRADNPRLLQSRLYPYSDVSIKESPNIKLLNPRVQSDLLGRKVKACGSSETMRNRDVPEIARLYEELIERFHEWAESRFDIRAAIIVGSRARVDHPADEWADLDILIVTKDPNHYALTSNWINNFGKPLLTFIEPTSTGDEKERRVLYDKMLDVDFAIIPQEKVLRLFQTKADRPTETGADQRILAQIRSMLSRGVRVLIDKDGLAGQLSALNVSAEKRLLPTQDEFLEIANDFLYHAVFTAKHLRRGELWWTVMCLDCHMQQLLLRMIEWHAQAASNWKHDTWFRGRFLEEWAHPQAVKGLHETFSHYDEKDVRQALLAAIDLFHGLATETAAKLGYPYPAEADKKVTNWIKTCVSEV